MTRVSRGRLPEISTETAGHLTRCPAVSVDDWGSLDRPPPALREWFDQRDATYRTITTDRDVAELAVWQTGDPGPLSSDLIATGIGCVAIGRQGNTVTTEVINCPSTLQREQPSSTATSWGRDSAALSQAEGVAQSPDQEVRWLMTKESNGYPRTTARSIDQVVAAVHRAYLSEGERFELTDVKQHDRTVTGWITAYDSGPDPIDPDRRVQAKACARLTVELDNLQPNFLFTSVSC